MHARADDPAPEKRSCDDFGAAKQVRVTIWDHIAGFAVRIVPMKTFHFGDGLPSRSIARA